ncbi:MAG TPA: cupin domain-containing protein, partial [Gemmatimonadales bacterium]|nr:cupin domain-containing protein [Gemmatimonadales bacterium]
MHLVNRHTGERLEVRRVTRGGDAWLELRGSLPPGRQGPPMHVHHVEDESGHIREGTLSAVLDGRPISVRAGESTFIPRGTPHRWWNDGPDLLEFDGTARPVADLDQYLQA